MSAAPELDVVEAHFKRVRLRRLVVKEAFVGLSLGLASGIPMGALSWLWFHDAVTSLAVATAMTLNGVIAVFLGMLIPSLFAKLGKDPALGTDEITTALSDNLSMIVYLAVATFVLMA